MASTADRPTRAPLGGVLLDLLVPQDCAGCGRAGVAWCSVCRQAVAQGGTRLDGRVAGAAAGEHAGPLGRAVVAFKDGGRRGLAGPLGASLADAVCRAVGRAALPPIPIGAASPSVWLIPVPSRPDARRRRGTDHMAVLAARAARELRRRGWRAHRCRLLTLVGDSRDQVGLDRQQRQANLAGTMLAAAPPAGVLVIVDDVTTTGATLAEAVRAVRAAGQDTPRAAGPAAPWPIMAATVTVATRARGNASRPAEH